MALQARKVVHAVERVLVFVQKPGVRDALIGTVILFFPGGFFLTPLWLSYSRRREERKRALASKPASKREAV